MGNSTCVHFAGAATGHSQLAHPFSTLDSGHCCGRHHSCASNTATEQDSAGLLLHMINSISKSRACSLVSRHCASVLAQEMREITCTHTSTHILFFSKPSQPPLHYMNQVAFAAEHTIQQNVGRIWWYMSVIPATRGGERKIMSG
jgi:hypothetical protein